MDKAKLSYLWHRYLNDASTSAELQELENALLNKSLEPVVNEVLKEFYQAIPQRDIINRTGSKAKDRAFAYILSQPQHKLQVKLWPYIASAAAVLLIIGIAIFLYNGYSDNKRARHLAALSRYDIAPGKNTATITLSNGKTIGLSESKNGIVISASGLTYNDGSSVNDQSTYNRDKITMLTASTPRGGTYQVTLPDGTKVWLNAASSLEFPSTFSVFSSFSKGPTSSTVSRTVKLVGEAYFEVAKAYMPDGSGKRIPFLVSSKGQLVEVLGTHFNINSYATESATKTTLLEGSVKVNEATLKPGQQAILTASKVKVVQANLETVMDWKHDDFVFKDEDFKTTMQKIARWYDVDIIYAPGLANNIKLVGWISRKSKLSTVLRRIEQAGKVHFKIEGRTIIVEQ